MSAEKHKRYSYRNLIVWDRAQELAIAVIELTQKLPYTWANAILARQIIVSATSIGANIAEGHGRYTLGAHKQHLSIVKGSATETDSWLDLLRRKGVLSAEEEHKFHQGYTEIIAMLTSKIRDLENAEQSKTGRIAEQFEDYQPDDSALIALFPYIEADYLVP